MTLLRFVTLIALLSFTKATVYEESIGEILSQCILHQHEPHQTNRTRHLCEKLDFDDDYSYFINELETRYSKRKFWCFSFFKEEFFKLNFNFWFSHSEFTINAFGVKFVRPLSPGDRWESSVKTKTASIVILPNKNALLPQIFGFVLNGHDKCPYCGKRLQSVGLIADGKEVVPARFPWHAALFYQEGFNLAYKCGATIIRDNVVLTASHCVTRQGQKLTEKIMKVRVEQGELLSSSSHQSNVHKSIVHENYNHETYENDIALLMLESKITFTTKVQAICLPNVDLENKGVGTAVGFGSTEKSVDHSNVLREVEIRIVDHETCLDSDADYFSQHLFEGNFCAGEIGVQRGVCQGDSGGGLYFEKDNLWFLKGITSNTKQSTDATNPSCNQASYAIFTAVNKYLEWIDTKIKSMNY